MNFSMTERDGKKIYTIDGVEYERLEDLPEQYQKFFEDANKNGTPDNFENPAKAMKALLKMAAKDVKRMVVEPEEDSSADDDSDEVNVSRKRGSGSSFQTSSSTTSSNTSGPSRDTPIYNRQERREGERSSSSFFIKMFVVAFIGMAAAWVYINYIKPKMEQPSEETTQTPPAENGGEQTSDVVASESEPVVDGGDEQEGDAAPVDDAASDISITIEDPNEKPYRMFAAVYEKDVRLLTIDVPDYYQLDNSDKTFVRFIKVEKEQTNLSEASIQFYTSANPCEYSEELEFSKATIGDNEFDKGVAEGYESRKSYITRLYSIERNGHCMTFSLSMQITNPGFLGPDVKTFDAEAEIKMFEGLLATLKFDNQ